MFILALLGLSKKVKNSLTSIKTGGLFIFPKSSANVFSWGKEIRRRTYTHEVTLKLFITQFITSDRSCHDAISRFNASRAANGLAPVSLNTGAYCRARAKITKNGLEQSAKQIYSEIENNVPAAQLWRGKHIVVIDGTTFSMADTPSNQEAFPQHGNQKLGCGFPLCRAVALFSLHTGAIVDFKAAPYQGQGNGELSLASKLLSTLGKNEIVLGDALYSSYFVMASLILQGTDFVFHACGSRKIDFRKGYRVGKYDHIVCLKKPQKPKGMDRKMYDQLPDEISVRISKTKLNIPGSRVKALTTISSFIDSKKATKDELALLYKKRWFGELFLRNIKASMGMA